MATEPLISVRHLRKAFTIFDRRPPGARRSPFRRRRRRDFYALDDVSLDLYPGDILGVIGPNGAGKSTLLRVIGGIYQPTQGEMIARGRIHALFELASGFNAFLTGRENVYQKAAMMGLSPEAIAARFDEIVDFAELDDFIDLPLTTYSTGMQARLAFAVATATDAEIFLIDEILSVGDEYFQGKCWQRIKALTGQDKAAILVTHDIASFLRLATHGMYLEQGRIIQTGQPLLVAASYAATFPGMQKANHLPGLTITDIDIEPQGQSLTLRVHYAASAAIGSVKLRVIVERIDSLGWVHAIKSNNDSAGLPISDLVPGETGCITVHYPAHYLGPGRYYVGAGFVANDLALGSAPLYDSRGWLFNDFHFTFELPGTGTAAYTYPLRWTHQPPGAAPPVAPPVPAGAAHEA